ncbi:MAG: NAD-dependent epimerase/dehydratase family protein [Ferruginibacter sp.]
MKVAITGAAGHLGAALLQEFCKRNLSVRALFRDADVRSSKDLPVEIIYGDMLEPGVLKSFFQNCDTVIHCAAVISVNGDPTGIVHQTNVEGTQIAIDAALVNGIKRFIHISSIHAFQQQPTFEVLNEQRTHVTGKAFAYDRSKLAGQQVALAANGPDMEVIVIHPTSIIGPYDFKPSLMGQVIIDLYKGKLPFLFNGGFDFCDCRDVANAIANTTTTGRPGEAYLLGGKWYNLKQLAVFLSAASSKKIKPIALSQLAARAGIPVVKLIAAIKRKEPLYTIEAVEALFEGNRFINSSKAITELNYTIRPFEETIHDTFHWFKNKGYLD